MRLKIFSTQAILGLLFVVTFLVTTIQPIFAQEEPDSGIRSYIPDTPSQSSICGIADGRQATVISNGQCNTEYLTGICSNIIDFTSKALSGYTWTNGACTVKVEGEAGLYKLQQESQKGIIAGVQNANAFLLDQRPLSTKEFFEEKIYAIQNFGNVSAQEENPLYYYPGTGFSLLQPIQSFWGWAVNIVYGLLIFIIIGVALSIVFRSSLNGQAVVTIQNAIPNIALAMILVPLSYAISGLFIDAVTVGTNVVHQFLIGPGSPGYDVFLSRNEELGDRRTGTPAFDAGFYDRGLYADDDRVNWINARNGLEIQTEVDGLINFINNTASAGGGGFQLVSGIANIFGYTNGSNGWIGAVVNFVVSIILLLTGIRIFWKLLQKWVIIIVAPIFAPFVFATIAIPGNGTNAIMNYVKTLGGFSATYIAAYAMILLSMVLSSRAFQASIPDFATTGYIPPLMGLEQFLGATGGTAAAVDTNLVGFYLSLGALVVYLLIPKTLDTINKQLGSDGLPIFSIITDAIGSAKDSINLGKNIANAPKNINAARTKAFQSTMNAIDRARGMRPGEDGTYLARRRARLSSRLAELEQKRQEAIDKGNWGAAAYYATRIGQVNRTIGDTDTAAGGDGKKTEGANELQLKVAWNGVDGALDIATAFNSLEQAGNSPMTLPGGSLTLISKQPFYPDKNISRTNLGTFRGKPVNVGFNSSTDIIAFNDMTFMGFAYKPPSAAPLTPVGALVAGMKDGQPMNIYGAGTIPPQPIYVGVGPKGNIVFEVYVDVNPSSPQGAVIQPDKRSAKIKLNMKIFNPKEFIIDVLNGSVNKSTTPEEIKIQLSGAVFGQRDVPLRASRGIVTNGAGLGIRSSVTNVINRSSRENDPLASATFNAGNR